MTMHDDGCMYCLQPLALAGNDGWAHTACQSVVSADDEATQVHDNRAEHIVAFELRERNLCPVQIARHSFDSGAIYCGREIYLEEDLFCAEHQCDYDGDEGGAAEERAARTRSLLLEQAGA
jgi:hypothetical protein